jgi:hypothetical protein
MTSHKDPGCDKFPAHDARILRLMELRIVESQICRRVVCLVANQTRVVTGLVNVTLQLIN